MKAISCFCFMVEIRKNEFLRVMVERVKPIGDGAESELQGLFQLRRLAVCGFVILVLLVTEIADNGKNIPISHDSGV